MIYNNNGFFNTFILVWLTNYFTIFKSKQDGRFFVKIIAGIFFNYYSLVNILFSNFHLDKRIVIRNVIRECI